jgi:signal transduction histidine kinase
VIATLREDALMDTAAARATILVIDDELGPRESLRFLFKDQYEVLCADSVDAGIRLLQERSPDVIILDIKMPGKNGIDGLQEIRQLDPLIQIVMLTGFGSLRTAQLAMRHGANEYVRKPFDTREMREIIERRIQQSQLDRRRAAAEVELRGLNDRMRGELAQKEKLAELGQYSSEIVHDLRNPLTVIYGYVHLLMEEMGETKTWQGRSTVDAGEYLSIIEKNVQRCERMLQTWKARRDVGGSTVRVPVAVNGLLEEVVEDIQPVASERCVRVSLTPAADGVLIAGDRAELLRALLNLATNAVQACPREGGQVQIEAAGIDGEGRLSLRVRDTGCGIPDEQLASVCSPYFTTKKNSGGMGLGLYITQTIIQSHGGTLALANNRPAPGVTATVTFPLVPAAATC